MNITDPIVTHARDRGDHCALIHGHGIEIGYRDLDRLLDAVAARLLDRGVRPGAIAMLAVASAYRMLVLALALARLGAVAAPTTHPPWRANAWIGDDPNAPAPVTPALLVDESWFDPALPDGRASVLPHRDPDAVAIVHASAGTTGVPKSMPVTHARMARRIGIARLGVPQPQDARVMSVSGAYSGYGFIKHLRALWDGATMILPRTPEDAVPAMLRHRVTHLAVMPFWVERILAALPAGPRPAPSIVQLEFGGSFLPRPLYDAIRARLGCEVHCVYGATEVGFVAAGPMSELIAHDRAVGRVIPGAGAGAFDDDGRPLPPGSEGRLWLRSDGMAERYDGDDVLTAETFRDGWVVTSDVGSVSEDGLVRLGGRVRDLINVGGITVPPRPIEDALMAVPGIRDAAVFGVPGPSGIARIWAAIVVAEGVDRAALETALRIGLADRKPQFIVPVESIPRNADGKVLRDRLVAMATSVSAGDTP